MVSVIDDMVQRDTVIFGRSFGAEEGRLTVADLKSAIQAQKVSERCDVRPLPMFCTPGLRM